ncbi:SubName: Full=Uncharacterized protein {ECO:0000313/EMBL:CCA70360.1} [Serendipita indica DSM 11827]|nr:SubName: Full=Uncharacterized protein {ECO:0000313/EMBL:CCA70360.1} [Serendipita indica DSM 11827]
MASSDAALLPSTPDPAKVSEMQEKQRESAAQLDRMGTRGVSRNMIDEQPLPTLNVDMVPDRPADMKELYIPYYPQDIMTWPFFFKKLWNPYNWSIRGLIRFLRPANWDLSFPNPIAYYNERKEKGPKALAHWNRRIRDYNASLDAMLQMAQHQRFEGYTWPAGKLAERDITALGSYWKDRKARKKEDTILTDLSAGENSPLRGILLQAAEVYEVMNAAVSEGKTSNLARFADKTYLTELEKRAKRISDCRKIENPVDYKWEFGHWINPPQCLSIRAIDYFGTYSKAYLTGDRLYVNMLVKFESVQTMTITESFRNGPYGELQRREPQVQTREVTEYLILDVRTWVPGRKPKFIHEVFEGQDLKFEIQTYDPSADNQKPVAEEGTSTDGAVPAPGA